MLNFQRLESNRDRKGEKIIQLTQNIKCLTKSPKQRPIIKTEITTKQSPDKYLRQIPKNIITQKKKLRTNEIKLLNPKNAR